MSRLLTALALLALAALAAGLFGALHNQVSYTVGPSYFTDLKFAQFRIPEMLHGRVGAALVGWRASWWMGLVIGVPAFGLGMLLLPAEALWRAGARAVLRVVLFAALGAALGLISAPFLREQMHLVLPRGVSDPEGFFRAGMMHNGAYLGGLAGLIAALWTIIRARVMMRVSKGERHET